jgi:catalase (peroxidase I)
MGTPPSGHADIPQSAKYDKELEQLDVPSVASDLKDLMSHSQECWPADGENYGPFFIRLAWHCSGSYRQTDGKGGCTGGKQRFSPEADWDDNTNLDKARALLWPIKEKYGDGLSWGDLFTLAGTVAIESMGGPIYKYCAGRIDEEDNTTSIVLGPSREQKMIAPCEVDGKCEKPLGTTTMGLIYLNPEGPIDDEGIPQPVPLLSAKDVRDAFSRMGFTNDRDTVALIGGGHTFGKTHGACPEGVGAFHQEDPLLHWPGRCGTGKGADTFTSGIEGPWTRQPSQWDNEFFNALLSRSGSIGRAPATSTSGALWIARHRTTPP